MSDYDSDYDQFPLTIEEAKVRHEHYKSQHEEHIDLVTREVINKIKIKAEKWLSSFNLVDFETKVVYNDHVNMMYEEVTQRVAKWGSSVKYMTITDSKREKVMDYDVRGNESFRFISYVFKLKFSADALTERHFIVIPENQPEQKNDTSN